MNVMLPLSKMTTAEKLMAMEPLQDDLCRSNNELSSLSWHAGVLADRDNSEREGTGQVFSWDEAKKTIRGSL